MKTALIVLALTVCWAGCSKPAPEAANTPVPSNVRPGSHPPPPAPAPAPIAEPKVTAAAPTVVIEQPPIGMKICFACEGRGQVVCNAPTCKDGMADCPNGCLKLSEGTWEHLHMDGYSDELLWRIFTHQDGTRLACGQDHLGDVMEMRDGKWTDIGKCPVCGGTTKVPCKVCGGTGKIICPVCEGKKFVPEQWTAFNNPKQKNPPREIHLKSGETIFGKVEARVGSTVYVRTEDDKQVPVPAADIVSEQ